MLSTIINAFIILLSGLGVFLFGIHTLSKSISQIISKRVNNTLSTLKQNNLKGLMVGTTTSAIAHSSSAVCALTLTLLDKGIITLSFAASIVLGANIGTTFTGLFTAISVIDISKWFALLVVLGLALNGLKNPKLQALSNPLIGIGLIFIGLEITSSAFDSPIFVIILSSVLSNLSYPPLIIIISLLFTAIVQSSTLTVALSFTLAISNVIPVYSAMYIVLGADAGTCITTVIASIGTSQKAKILAKFQVAFNLISIVFFGSILMSVQKYASDFINSLNPSLTISIFHFSFNLIGAIITLPLLTKMFKTISKKHMLTKRPNYIDNT